jgi:hypothetical protein
MLSDNTPEAVRKDAENIDARIKEFRERRHGRPTPPPANDQADGTDVTTPGTPRAEPEATQTPTGTPTETEKLRLESENAELRRKAADLQRQVDVANGKFGGTIQGLKANIVDLQREIAELRTAKPEPAIPSGGTTVPIVPDGKPWLAGVSVESIDKYGEEFFEAMWRTSRTEYDVLRNDLKAANVKAEARIRQMEDRYRTEKFAAQIDALCPGASSINGDPSTGIGCAEGWAEFLDTPVRNGGILTRRQEAEAAAATGNAAAFAALVVEFRNSKTSKPTTQRQEIASQVVPASVRARSLPETGKRKIPESEVRAWSEQCGKAPPGTIPAAEVDKKMREYAEARREGRIYRD